MNKPRYKLYDTVQQLTKVEIHELRAIKAVLWNIQHPVEIYFFLFHILERKKKYMNFLVLKKNA